MAYIILVIAAIAAIVVMAVWFNRRRNQRLEEVKEEEVSDEEEKSLCDYYSPLTAESCITKNSYNRPEEDKSLRNNSLHNELWEKLQKVNKHSLIFRNSNDLDIWFVANVDSFYQFNDVLAYIEHYPELTDLFIANIGNHDDVELQKKLISVYTRPTQNFARQNYINLLCRFCTKWDLLPEIKAVVMLDPRFETARKIYELYHT